MHRLFVGIPIDDAFRVEAQRVQSELDTQGVTLRWSQPGQLHLTVKFLGDVSQEHVPDICEAMHRVARAGGRSPSAWAGSAVFPSVVRCGSCGLVEATRAACWRP